MLYNNNFGMIIHFYLFFQKFFTYQSDSIENNLNANTLVDSIYFTNSPSQNLYNLEVNSKYCDFYYFN